MSQFEDAPVGLIAVWVVALVITGAGVGMAWPHLSAWAMGCVDDPAEGGAAAAAINTVQLICGAFGAGLAGVVVNMTDRATRLAARWMFAVFAVLAAVGLHRVVQSTGSKRRRIVADGRGGLIDESREVEECVAACEVGQCADDEPGDTERFAHLRDGTTFHLDRLPAQLTPAAVRGVVSQFRY